MKLHEMEGFLRGKCLPGDMLVNETNAEYLIRKISGLEAQAKQLAAERDAVVAEMALVKNDYATITQVQRIGWPSTPCTDSIIASLRAEAMADGVIALADKVKSLPYFVGVKQQFIRNFAAQLRSKSEVQS